MLYNILSACLNGRRISLLDSFDLGLHTGWGIL